MARKKRRLRDLQVTKVSYVDSAANMRTFYLMKQEDVGEPDFSIDVRLLCSKDGDKKKVYGIVYAPDIVDAHGDWADAETIEKAADDFMIKYRNMDVNHNMKDGAGEIAESYVAPVDFEINGEKIKKGTWIIASIPSDDVWENIKKGKITGYSLYGTAKVEREKSFNDAIETIYNTIKTLLNPVEENMDELVKALNGEIAVIKEKIELIAKSVNENADIVLIKNLVDGIKKSADLVTLESIESMIEKHVSKSMGKIDETISKKLQEVVDAVVKAHGERNNGSEDEKTDNVTKKSRMV